ncbi:MAG: peptide chain release factor N(5)-glutamine methyltransferase [Deltaproteobacteria bacterium]|nr:MAG: peptide chain release factor N(5)-glutamine methyltransferase [Deltaproteobacteria bacterium]
MPDESWTILKLLQWTTSYFEERSVAEPRTSAEVLLAHVLRQDRLFLYLNYDRPMETRELSAFRECVKRRAAGEPSQYITGTQEFWSLPLQVSPDVLIPRPETELLVEAVLEFVRGNNAIRTNLRILDLGTGSGAIAIALAKEMSTAEIVAIDLSTAALRLARENAHRHKLGGRIHFVRGDLLAGIPVCAEGFNVVVTNPPYVSQTEFQRLPREIRNHEPRHALDGGPDGLAVISCIVKEAPGLLRPSGGLFLEMGAGQSGIVSKQVARNKQYRYSYILRDYSGLDRVLVAEKS